MRRRLLFLGFLAVLLVPATSFANVEPERVYVFTRGSYAGPSTSEILTPVVFIPEGSELYLFNLHVWGHSMYSVANGLNDRLFWSEHVPFGKSTLVHGVSRLSSGTYEFFCANHPDMKGTLTILDKEEL